MILECGLKPAVPVLVAVSGGADSLALLHTLRGTDYPLLVASFNHRLRPEAETDIAHVRQIAAQMGLPFVSDSADVAAHAAAEGLSIEESARHLRYRFLFNAARQAGAQAVATGHTADDQAETVLMHFLRGAGLNGLKGMSARSLLPTFDNQIPLVRPLLAWTRAQTEAYCREQNLPYLTDSTNADTTYLRNRLRHHLLPQLETYNPQIRQTLAKTALALQGDHELLTELVDSAWGQAIRATGFGFVSFDLPSLQSFAPALRRHLFRRAAFSLQPNLRDIDFDALTRAASLQATDLAGGLKTILENNLLYLTDTPNALPANAPQISNPYREIENLLAFEPNREILLPIGELRANNIEIPLENNWRLSLERRQLDTALQPFEKLRPSLRAAASAQDYKLNAEHCILDADSLTDNLWLRPFRAGDRFEPLGMPGKTIKLSDLFTNLKIPQRLRAKWPLLMVGEEIAWVLGLRASERFKVTDKTRQVLSAQIKRLP